MSFQPWNSPDPQSIAGLNSQKVYGENIQFTTGLNHQVALGSNLQLCMNPMVMFNLMNVPGTATLAGLWGSGLGGNTQFTIGTSTSVVWGRQFQVNMGPEQITVTANPERPLTLAILITMGAACLAYSIAYGLITDENDRATAVIIFQGAIDILLGAFMMCVMAYKSGDATISEELKTLFGSMPGKHSTTLEDFSSALSIAFLVGAVIAPPIAMATEENHFNAQQPPQDTCPPPPCP